jgi:hypothetical protein
MSVCDLILSRTLILKFQFIQDSALFRVQFIQDSGLFRVQFIEKLYVTYLSKGSTKAISFVTNSGISSLFIIPGLVLLLPSISNLYNK